VREADGVFLDGDARPDGLGPLTGWLLDHWRSLRPGPGLLPSRAAFDPTVIGERLPRVLPHLWLLDVVRGDRLRFRYRLVGGALAAAGGTSRPGDHVDDYDATGRFGALLAEATRSGRPWFRRGRPMLRHAAEVVELEILVLPLAADGRTVDMLLNCTVYHWQEGFGPAGGP
jgi:hypothetical protein